MVRQIFNNRKHRLRPFWVGNNPVQDRSPGEPSAVIQIDDKDGGFLTARLTTAERDAIQNPATGVMIFNTDTNMMEVYDGNSTSWSGAAFGGGGGGAVASVFGRTGAVIAVAGDYGANQVSFTPAAGITATDAQSAIAEVQSNLASTNLGDLSDVTVAGATTGQVLVRTATGWSATTIGGVTSSVVADITARNAITGQATGDLAYVTDASGDASVNSGAALYVWDGAAWEKISEFESLDLSAFGGANGLSAGTAGIVPAPAATDNVNFLRGDGTWAAAVGVANNRVHADDTTVNPGSNGGTAGNPSLAEIQTFATNSSTVDALLYYTGDDVPASTPTYVYWVDAAGVATQLDAPVAGGSFIIDADADTFVTVEQTADADTIVMQVAGNLTHNTGNVASLDATALTISGLDAISGNTGGRINLSAGLGEGAGAGGNVAITAGSGGSTGNGGNISITTGGASGGAAATGSIQVATSSSATALTTGDVTIGTGNATTGSAGDISITPGTSGGANNGGIVFITGGDANSGAGGNIQIRGGSSTSGDSGSITMVTTSATGVGQVSGSINIQTGDGNADATAGSVRFNIGSATALGTPGSILIGNSNTNAGQTTELRFEELSSNGSQYVAFKAPDAIATNTVWSLPDADGTAGQPLITDGAGNLSFGAAANYTNTFNATTSWGAAAGGYYTITIASATHGVSSPTLVQVWENEAGDFVLVQPDRLVITAAGDVTVRVTATPDARFAGRVVIS